MSTRARSAFATRSCAQTGSRFLCVVAFSAENRKSTFPENAPVLQRQQSEVAALEVAAQVEAHVRIGISAEIVVVVVNRIGLHPLTRLSLFATNLLVVLRGMLRSLDAAARAGLCESRRSNHGGERRRSK